MPSIPPWIQIFVIAGVVLVAIGVPLRVIWEMTRGMRDRARRLLDLSDRLKERFGEVRMDRAILGRNRIHFTYEGRPATIAELEDKELGLRVEPKVPPVSHVVIRTRGRVTWPTAILWESLRVLPRAKMLDPLLDESIAIYAAPVLGGYLRERVAQGLPAGGKPEGMAESLIVLRRLPGVAGFELRMSPSGGFRIVFRLRSEELLFRPDELESAVHHAFRLYDALALG